MDGQRSHGGASRSLGGRDIGQSLSSNKRRWIPPSSLRRDALNPELSEDATFRKVRGILNKITPEKFFKLSNDILDVGLNSINLLKGVILLIFEKALDESKYCSMYARLCKKLSEEVPNFEANDGSACTFKRLLLAKCREEFEHRRKVSALWDRANRKLTPEEEEQRSSARRKMVGNLRFIGELGKLEIVRKDILHSCIQQLLEKKRHQTVDDLAEDMECLCQMMRTGGKVLDKPEAKNLMDQYFERMCQLSVRPDLPSRIRFMLQDCIELRAANWVPRKVAQQEGPRTIQQVRQEAARDLGVYIPPPNSQGRPGPISPLSTMPSFFPQGTRTGMEDVFGMAPMGAVSLGTGPGVISSQPERFSYEANGFNASNRDQAGYRGRTQQSAGNFYQNKHFNVQNYNRQNQQSNYNAANKDLPPRFMKMFSRGNNSDEVSLRPTSSMSLKPKTPNSLPTSGQFQDPYSMPVAQPQPPNQKPLPIMHKQPPIIIKTSSNEKSKMNKKDRSSKDELMQRVQFLVGELIECNNVGECVQSFKAIKLPDKFIAEATKIIILRFLKSPESSRDAGALFLVELRKENVVSLDKMLNGIKQVLNHREDFMEGPCAKSLLSSLLASLVIKGAVTLAEMAELIERGNQYPLIFDILQVVHKTEGKTALLEMYNDSKVNLMTYLPENDRTKEKLADLLEDRELSFLDPLLRIEADLWKALLEDPSPHTFYKYIKATLDPEHHENTSFINALLTVLVKYITKETTLQAEVDPTVNPDKVIAEQEKDLLSKFKPILQAFLHEHIKLQVTALYSLQVFTFTNGFPKGMLVRWFVYFYDLEIIDEEAFLTWKEDLSQEYPGKGKALFQVNQWLTWLQETEEYEEEDDMIDP